MSIWTKRFWKAAGERAVKTGAQAAALAIGADSLAANALAVDWSSVGGFALGGVVLSLLTSVASSTVGDDGPSLAGEHLEGE